MWPVENLDVLLTQGYTWFQRYLIIALQMLQTLTIFQIPERSRAAAVEFASISFSCAIEFLYENIAQLLQSSVTRIFGQYQLRLNCRWKL